MKKFATTTLKNFCRMFGGLAILAFAAGTVFAEDTSKTFEFGEGTAQPRSHVSTFPIPCGTAGGISAHVNFRRLGPNELKLDIPIVIELREPDTAPGQEGPLVETKTTAAKTTGQTVILSSRSSNRGCSLPWRVRVRHADDGTAPFKTFGIIKIAFDGRSREIDSGDSTSVLKKGNPVTKNIGDLSGLNQGKIEITGTWSHVFGGGTNGPNSVRLKFELIAPNGTVVSTATGISSNEAGSESLKLKLTYQIANHSPGQWKLRITNIDEGGERAANVNLTANFVPGCP